MNKIYLGSAYNPKQVIVDGTKTIKQLFIDNMTPIPNGAIVTLNDRRLGDAELEQPLGNVAENTTLLYTNKLIGA